MVSPVRRSSMSHFGAAAFAAASALTASFWVGICAAAPEFIWRGLRIELTNPSWASVLPALLIGLILAFFVEPAMEHVQKLLHRVRHRESTDDRPRNPLYIASLSFVFALTSVSLHEAMSAFVYDEGVAAGVKLATAWAIVPFAVTLAWESVRCRFLAIPMGIVAVLSTFFAGWLFSWSLHTIIIEAVPGVLIQFLGYRQVKKEPRERAFARCARRVALVGVLWLAIVPLVDWILGLAQLDHLHLYSASEFFIDVRFFFGWTLGLLFAPSPYDEATGRRAASSG